MTNEPASPPLRRRAAAALWGGGAAVIGLLVLNAGFQSLWKFSLLNPAHWAYAAGAIGTWWAGRGALNWSLYIALVAAPLLIAGAAWAGTRVSHAGTIGAVWICKVLTWPVTAPIRAIARRFSAFANAPRRYSTAPARADAPETWVKAVAAPSTRAARPDETPVLEPRRRRVVIDAVPPGSNAHPGADGDETVPAGTADDALTREDSSTGDITDLSDDDDPTGLVYDEETNAPAVHPPRSAADLRGDVMRWLHDHGFAGALLPDLAVDARIHGEFAAGVAFGADPGAVVPLVVVTADDIVLVSFFPLGAAAWEAAPWTADTPRADAGFWTSETGRSVPCPLWHLARARARFIDHHRAALDAAGYGAAMLRAVLAIADGAISNLDSVFPGYMEAGFEILDLDCDGDFEATFGESPEPANPDLVHQLKAESASVLRAAA